MSILTDIRSASMEAVDLVTSTVSTVTADVPAAVSPGEEFTFNVTAANTNADAIELKNVIYHLTVSSSAILQLKVPASPPARSSLDPSAPTLTVGSFVSVMYLFPTDNDLKAGETQNIPSLKGKAVALGNANVKSHIHAEPNLTGLFPNTSSVDGSRNVIVT